jgi:16S rRNA (cytosine967-C5)-methyltransferase
VRLDVPDWLWPDLTESLSGAVEKTLAALKERAPVFVRVNTLKSDMASAIAALESEGIECRTHHLSPTALEITAKSQRIADCEAYRDGWIELQDVASQAIVDHISPNLKGASVLDYCAGGGGKSLAMAAYGPDRIVAHDIDAKRMADLPDRAARAGCTIDIVASPAGTFDVVFCDCPCSGSGAWRRQPEAKWTLTSTRLSELNAIQDQILTDGAAHVGPGGILVYATCSMLRCENDARIDVFIRRNPDWRVQSARTLSPLEGGDGFFVAVLERAI